MILKSEFRVEKIRRLMRGFVLTVFADEPVVPVATPTPDPTPTTNTVNYEDLIARARQEEKNKLYPEITKLKAEVQGWVEKHNQDLLTIGSKDTEIAQLKQANSGKDNKVVTDLQEEVKKLKADLEEANKKVVDPKELEATLRTQISAEYEIKNYKDNLIRDNDGAVIPELVIGNTKEELDASVEASKKRFAELFGKVATPKAPAKVPSANVNTSKLNSKEFNLEDLKMMDVTSPAYKEMREKLGLNRR